MFIDKKSWITLSLVFFILSGITYLTYYNSHGPLNKDKNMATAELNPTSRAPASLPDQQLSVFQEKKDIVSANPNYDEKIKLDCKLVRQAKAGKEFNFNYEYRVKGKHLVLELVNCEKELKAKNQFSLINKTNGYNAQLFILGKEEIKSDFIQINSGENIFSLEVSSDDGQKKLISFKINRL